MDDFQTLVDFENLYNSYRTSMRGKGKKLSAAKFDVMALENLYVMKKQLINHTYRISPYSEFIVTEPIRDKLKENDGYCPCRISRTEDTKCMCKEFREMIDNGEAGMCHCGLYIIEEDN